jgi:hypothetical protein
MINFEFQFGAAISSRIRGRTREQPEAYLYGTLRIASAENEEDGQKHPPKSKVYGYSGLGAECACSSVASLERVQNVSREREGLFQRGQPSSSRICERGPMTFKEQPSTIGHQP